MTTEEKAKAYDEALEKARAYFENENYTEMADVFPELAESEDERIRKELLSFIESVQHSYLCATDRREKWIAYLEKHKEQKFTHHEIDESLQSAVTHQMEDDGDVDDFVRKGIDDIVLKYAELGARWQKEQKLTENEDDKMIDEIINTVTGYHPTHSTKEINEMVAWLEGQKSISKRIDAEVNRRVHDMIREAREKWESKVDDAIDRMGSDELGVYLEENKEPNIPKPHKGDDSNPYDMGVSQAQEYAINRGFGVPFNDGEVYVDERHMTQTIGNILRWADEHPKEQISNIELLQKSWYTEGYHDREFNNEPKWIIKTGEGGPRYEENPKYGQHIEKQDYSGLNDFERAIHRGFLCAGVVNVPVNIIKETAQDCLAHLPVEWNEEDEKFAYFVNQFLGYHENADPTAKSCKDWFNGRFKSLRPKPHTVSIKDATKFGNLEYERGVKDGIQHTKNHQWKPTEEQMDRLFSIVATLRKDYCDDMADFLANLYADLKKLGVKEEPEYHQHFDPDC